MDLHSADHSQMTSPQQWSGPYSCPLPSFQHLSLASPDHHGPPSNQINHINNTNCLEGAYKPTYPSSLSFITNGTLLPQQSPQYPPPQLVPAHHRPPLTDQRLLNEPQSPLLKDPPINQLSYGRSITPSRPLDVAKNHVSPSSPVPQWTTQTPETFIPGHERSNTSSQTSPNSESRYGLAPESLPSAVKVMEEDRGQWEGKVFDCEPFSSRLPPLATTSCIMKDKGNATPCAIRTTSYCLPCDGTIAQLSHLPLGAVVSPLAGLNVGQTTLPVCVESDCIGGCRWCGAYMCPAICWQDCGQRYHCPFCGKLSEVPWQFFQPTRGVEGVRVDKDSRPELSVGSYEIIHSENKGEGAVLFLVIDVSVQSLRGGHLEFITQQIRTLLTSVIGAEGVSDVRVGLITYDSRVHLYDLSPALTRPHRLIITDTDHLQLPVTSGLLVPLRDCIDNINSVLQLVPQFGLEYNESSGVSIELPVRAALAILQALECPGQLLLFHAAPLTEMSHTQSSSGFFGSNLPKSIFEPPEPALSLVRQCVSQGCSVHLFLLSEQQVGGAWPGHIPYLTGGALHTYSHLQGELDQERFSTDLTRTFSLDTSFKTDLKIFVSKDLRVSSCYGLFVPGSNPACVSMATADWRTTLAVEIEHVRALDETRGVAIQTAMNYSTWSGERRTRIHTLTIKCSRDLQEVFRHFQAQTLLTFYCKKMYCAVLERPLQELREELQTQITEALACYRKHGCSASVSVGQLVLPQYLRALPVYINSLRKSEVLLPGLRSSVHQRLQQRCQVLSMNPSSTAFNFYPQILPLPVTPDPLNPGDPVRCSVSSLQSNGLYLVNAPLNTLLWVGAHVPNKALIDLFNNTFSSLPSGETKLPVLDNAFSTFVRSLICSQNSQVSIARKVLVVKQGDSCEEALQRHLVEDKSPNGGASYADFLYHLHVNSVRLLQRQM